MERKQIGINATGGDFGPEVILPAVASAVKRNPDIDIVLYVYSKDLSSPVSETIFELARGGKKCQSLRLVKCHSINGELEYMFSDMAEGKLDAIITATRSARLLASTLDYLEDHVERPGLIGPFPTRSEHKISYVIDVGATALTFDPQVYAGWAWVGAKFLTLQKGYIVPTIGLANISTEGACKEIRAIHNELCGMPGYVGYVEPKDFIEGKVDLLLTSGFVGNWTLKWTEAFSDLMFEVISKVVCTDPEAYKRLKYIQEKYMSYDAHLVSPLLGLKGGMVFRVHGAATSEQIAKAFEVVSTRYKI